MSHDDSAAAIYQLVIEQDASAQQHAQPRRSIWAEDLRTAPSEILTRPPVENTRGRTPERGR